MLILNLGTTRARLLVVILLACIFFLSFFRVTVSHTYTPEVLVRGGWGSADKAFGRVTGQDGNSYGPRSFAVDSRGRLYVADTYNQCVKVFGPGGQFLAVHRWKRNPEGRGPAGFDDIVVDANGNYYLLNSREARITQHEPSGTITRIWELRDHAPGVDGRDGFWFVERIGVGPGSTLYVQDMVLDSGLYLRRVRSYTRPGSKPVTVASAVLRERERTTSNGEAQLNQAVNGLTVGFDGFLYVDTHLNSPFRRTIWVLDSGGKLVTSYPVGVSEYIRSLALLGADGGGHLFAGLNLGFDGGYILELDRSGTEVARITGPGQMEVRSLVQGRVGPRGSLYLVESTEQEFRIVKYRRRVQRKIVPRFRF